MRSKRASVLLAAAASIALAGCETVAEEATEAVGAEFVADLRPVGAGGGAAQGKAEISLNDTTNMLCTDLELSPGVAMTRGYVLGPGGTVIADIDVPEGDNDSEDCDNVADAAVDSIRATPGAYWVYIRATSGDLSGPLRRERD